MFRDISASKQLQYLTLSSLFVRRIVLQVIVDIIHNNDIL